QVASVCPLLEISGTSFFFLTLSDEMHTLPVLVKLWWAQCVSLGESVCVTALRVCVLRPWGEKNILCATDNSEIHKTHDRRRPPAEDTPPDPPPLPPTSEPRRCEGEPDGRIKESQVINYQGTVTEVVSAGAGLYVMDRKRGLCLAYQPELKRKLIHVAVPIQLHHVHFLYQPCPDFPPPSMLCTCLRSTVTVTKFSAVLASDSNRNCPDDGVLQRLLVERNPDVSRYLWTCHLCSQLQHSLLPSTSPQCTCLLSWKLMEVAFGQGQRRRRDIYAEMLDKPHTCPYKILICKRWRNICVGLNLDKWAKGKMEIQNLILLFKMCASHLLGHRQRPLLLVGVLELPSGASLHTLQLRDRTGAIALCVCVSSCSGCLVCVQQFTMVTERFLQSDFPSYQHLNQHKFITHKHCSIYLQFSQESIHILSPSVAMEMHLRDKGEESGEEEEEKETVARKRRRTAEDPEPSRPLRPSPVPATSCVSVVLRVEQKTGVMWREDAEASFSVTATVIGPVKAWGRDPKNRPMKDFETGNEKKVTLLCSGASARWFPLLQPGRVYRLVASGTHVRMPPIHRRACPLIVGSPSGRRRSGGRRRPSMEPGRHPASPARLEVPHANPTPRTRMSLQHGVASSRRQVCGARCSMSSLQDASIDKVDPCVCVCLCVYVCVCCCGFEMRGIGKRPISQVISGTHALHLDLLYSRLEDRPPAPIMHLALWTRHSRTVGRVKGHVVCFLFMQLQWNCFECGSVYAQVHTPTHTHKDRRDGTGQAHVQFTGALVRQLLGLNCPQWEGLQRAVKARGHIQVYPRGRSQVGSNPCLPPPHRRRRLAAQVKRLRRGKRDFLTRMAPPLKLTCQQIH
uniref:CST complex subunit CTC1 n=1 Tax=Hippocampus comes TaxID=109280 RepID=A0A3Q3DW01_HIPCM